MRWKLLALITIPILTALALGGIRVSTAVHTAQSFQRIEQLAILGGDVTRLAQAMEDERDVTAGFIAAGRPQSGMSNLQKQYAVTDAAANAAGAQASRIGPSYPADARQQLSAVLARISDLQGLRQAALHTQLPSLPMITDYSQAIADLFAFEDEMAQGGASPTLADNVRTLGVLSRMKDQISQQRAILFAALISKQFEPGGMDALTSAQAQQAAELATYLAASTVSQRQLYADTVTGTLVDQAQATEQHAISLATANQPLVTGDPTAAGQQWYTAVSDTINRIRSVEQAGVRSIITESNALQQSATRSALLTGIGVLALLVLALAITAIIARSMIRPLRRLRAGALDVAGVQLPKMVRRLSETGGTAENLEIEPIAVFSRDEVGEVTRAFDQVHREALRLAANEAMLRGNVNTMFVSLSRRSQSLVERQIRLIDDLEQGEQDSERLSNLFRMDHLATRMRRNSENLLVLAGHEPARRWGKPVSLVDVLRAAVSEIEQYERVTFNVQPGTSVIGNSVNDVVHLLAELLENATSFSPSDTPVKVSGNLLNSGGVLLDITDQGVGMGAEEMAHANWRLENPPVVDVAVSRRMGLFVVARLAARHGIRVRLRQPELGGLTALVWLPDTLIAQEPSVPTRLRRFGALDADSGSSSLADVWNPNSGQAMYSAPAMPTATWNGPELGADMDPIRATDTGPMHAADTGPMHAADTGPMHAADTGPMHAADTGPMHAADTGPMRAADTQPLRAADPGLIGAGSADEAGPGDAGQIRPGDLEASQPGHPADTGPMRATGPLPTTGTGPMRTPGTGPMRTPGTGPMREIKPVVVPAGMATGPESRLPIYDSLESDWFHRRGRAPQRDTQGQGAGSGSVAMPDWQSAADDGWRAAKGASAPTVGPVTAAGLPRRVPQANIVPGSAGTRVQAPVNPALSAESARDRMASFQQGVRRARAVIKTENPTDG